MAQRKETDDHRLALIYKWVEADLNIKNFTIEVASADASFRRYFRLISGDNTWIIMDAPPEKENCEAFIKMAQLLESANVQAPHIYHFDEALGFMQLSDLGNTAYLDKLNDVTVDELYRAAIKSIIKMQKIKVVLPEYDSNLLKSEMSLFNDWFINRHLKLSLNTQQEAVLNETLSLLSDSALRQDAAFVHRDFHCRNLMMTNVNNPGVIDFQDAVNGPCSYDLVSLIKDCYIAWPRKKQLQWIDLYLSLSDFKLEKQAFIKSLDFMGMQRHMKAIGIFSRLNYRDAKPGYLNDIPRTMAYVIDVCHRYTELKPFSELLNSLNISVDKTLLEKIK